MTAGVKQEVHLPDLHPFRDESTFLTISSSSGNMHSRPGHQGKRINPDNTANCRGGAVLLGHQVLMRQSPEGVRQEGQEREREGGGIEEEGRRLSGWARKVLPIRCHSFGCHTMTP